MSKASTRTPALRFIVLSVLVCAVGLGTWVSLPLMLIFLAASALCGTIFLLWASLKTAGELDHMDFEEALSFSAPAAEEEQKLAVLRALKDLEYERSLGKITESDYEQAHAEYRAQAKRLIAAQDAAMKEQIEAAERRVKEFLKSRSGDSAADRDGSCPAKSDEITSDLSTEERSEATA